MYHRCLYAAEIAGSSCSQFPDLSLAPHSRKDGLVLLLQPAGVEKPKEHGFLHVAGRVFSLVMDAHEGEDSGEKGLEAFLFSVFNKALDALRTILFNACTFC